MEMTEQNKCKVRGCRNLETRCKDCGRLVCDKTLPPLLDWISVTDRLPNPDEHVLVYGEDGIFRAYRDYHDQYPSWQCYPIGSYAGDGCVYDISQWMPLPALPKE